jgi:hypothetical protein
MEVARDLIEQRVMGVDASGALERVQGIVECVQEALPLGGKERRQGGQRIARSSS